MNRRPPDQRPSPQGSDSQSAQDVDAAAVSEDLELHFARYAERMMRGEVFSMDQIREAHPTLGDQLVAQLRSFQQLDDADETLTQHTIGDYTILRKLAQGGMGVVYEAWQNSLERPVALKVLPSGIAAEPNLSARLIREARIAAQLNHPNIVSVFGTGVEQNTPYYAMELIDGETLAQKLERSRNEGEGDAAESGAGHDLHTYTKLARGFAGLASALYHAHGKGIVHRDIKPSNLMYDRSKATEKLPDGALRILDFGLARLDGQQSITRSGDLIGTVRYMSPEQAKAASASKVDHRTDIYSLGTALYEAITLVPPFQGEGVHETLSQIISLEPISPHQHNARVPPDLATIVLKCLRKDPEDRYQTAQALGQDLQRFVVGDPIEARPQTLVERWGKHARRHARELVTAAVVLVALSAALWSYIDSLAPRRMAREQTYQQRIESAQTDLRSVHPVLYQQNPIEVFLLPWGAAGQTPGEIEPFPSFGRAANKAPIDRAIERLDQAIELEPRRFDAYWYRARAHALLQRWAAAEQDVAAVLRRQPSFVPALFLRSELQRVQRKGDAGKDWEAAIAATKTQGAYASWYQAQRSFQGWQWGEAAAHFRATMALTEDNPPYIGWEFELRQGLQLSYTMSRRPLEAYGELTLLRDKFPEALDLHIAMGVARMAIGQRDQALEDFDTLWKNTKDSAIRDHIAETVCLQHAMIVQANRLEEQADRELLRSWTDRIQGPRLQKLVLYRMHVILNESKQADEVLRVAIQDFPEDPWFPLALANGNLWLAPEAHEKIRIALDRAPDLAYTRACYAFRAAYRSLEQQSNEALAKAAKQAIADTEQSHPQFTWEFIYLALAHGFAGNLDTANQLFTELSRRDQNPWIDHNRGQMLRMLAEREPSDAIRDDLLEQALHFQNIAIEKNPQRTFLRENCWTLRTQGDHFAAVDTYVKLAKGRGLSSGDLYNFAQAYRITGRYVVAFDTLLDLLRKNPSSASVHEALQGTLRHHAELGEVRVRQLVELLTEARVAQGNFHVLATQLHAYRCLNDEQAARRVLEQLEALVRAPSRDGTSEVGSGMLRGLMRLDLLHHAAHVAGELKRHPEASNLDLLCAATALAASDDTAGYRECCALMLSRFPDSTNTAKACLLLPPVPDTNPKSAMDAVVEKAAQPTLPSWQFPWVWTTKALFELRHHKYTAALESVGKCREMDPLPAEAAATCEVLRGAALVRLNRSDEAEISFRAAEESLARDNSPNMHYPRVLLREFRSTRPAQKKPQSSPQPLRSLESSASS